MSSLELLIRQLKVIQQRRSSIQSQPVEEVVVGEILLSLHQRVGEVKEEEVISF